MNIRLNTPYRLHSTPMDVENNRAIDRMYGGYNVRPGWMYPQGPYSGMGELGFNYYDLLSESGQEQCDPRDSGCVGRNIQRANAVEDLWATTYMRDANTANLPTPKISINVDTSDAARQAFLNNQPLTSESIAVAGGAPVTVATMEKTSPFYAGTGAGSAAGTNPRVAFTTSTGNTQLRPGDTWRINITGGAPNSQVTVTGGPNGRMDVTNMGLTDGSGQWQYAGTIDVSSIGNWSETWTVGGQNAGNVSFTVIAATQAQQSQATGKPNASVPPANDLTPGGTGFDKTADKLTGSGTGAGTGSGTGSGSAPVPDNTMLYVIGAGVALFLMTRKGGR